jgi:hypothetical protein
LCDALGGSAASFISHDFAASHAAVSVTARTNPEALAEYNHHWHRFDPWAHSPRSAQLQSGAVVVGDHLIGREDMTRTAYYNDFGRRYGIVQCLARMIEVAPHALSCISINATEQRRPFDSRDSGLLAALMPPLKRFS